MQNVRQYNTEPQACAMYLNKHIFLFDCFVTPFLILTVDLFEVEVDPLGIPTEIVIFILVTFFLLCSIACNVK